MTANLWKFLTVVVALTLLVPGLAGCATPTPETIEQIVTQKETVIVEGTPQVVEEGVTRLVDKGGTPMLEGMVVLPSPGESRAPGKLTLGLHIGIDILAEFNYPDGTWGDDSDWEGNLTRNMAWIAESGYDALLMDVILTEGYAFDSDVLAENGYHAFPDLLGHALGEAHANGLTVYADVTVLAWRLNPYTQEKYDIQGRPLSVEQVQQVVATLIDDYGVDGIIEETYTSDYVSGIYAVTRARGVPYVHKWDDVSGDFDVLMSEDYVGYLDSAALARELEDIGAVGNNLGVMTAVLSHSRALGIPGWVKVYGGWGFSPGASRNVMLLRAVQFQSDGYFWMSFGDDANYHWLTHMDTVDLRAWLDHLRTPPPGPRPVANVYMPWPAADAPDDVVWVMEMAAVHSFGPIANGLMLAGYDVRTTYDAPLSGADLTVVIVPGGVWDWVGADLPDDVLALLESDARVILVSATGIPEAGDNWRAALPLLGITPDWEPNYAEAMPETVIFRGATLRWQGFGIYDYPSVTNLIPSADLSGDAFLSAQVDGREVGLIVRRGNNAFLNGNLLNLDASYVITRLALSSRPDARTLDAPFYGYGAVGTRSAFMAMGEAELIVHLVREDGSAIEEGTPLRVMRFGEGGGLASDEEVTYSAPFRANLARHELAILEVAGAFGDAP
jgi:hypothetical protein